jgi:hypothetical protein
MTWPWTALAARLAFLHPTFTERPWSLSARMAMGAFGNFSRNATAPVPNFRRVKGGHQWQPRGQVHAGGVA